jgi:hypothetical protein
MPSRANELHSPKSLVLSPLIAAFLLFSRPVAAEEAFPACRRAPESDWIVQSAAEAVQIAMNELRRMEKPLPFTGVSTKASPPKEHLELRIILDADVSQVKRGCIHRQRRKAGPARRDPLSITGTCEASPGIIACSRGALAALAERDHEGDAASPALLYIMGHELSHLALGHVGAFSSSRYVVDLSQRVEDKLDALQVVASNQLPIEREADDLALKILERALVKPPYQDPSLSVAASLPAQSGRIRLAADAAQAWEDTWSAEGVPIPSAVENAPLPSSDAYVLWAVDRVLCDILASKKGKLALGFLSRSHPQPASRLRNISSALQKQSKQLPDGKPRPTALPIDLSEQIMNVGGITAALDQEYDEFLTRFTQRFDERVQSLGSVAELDCSHVPSRLRSAPTP